MGEYGSLWGDGLFITKKTNIWVEGTGASHPYSDANTLTLRTGKQSMGEQMVLN